MSSENPRLMLTLAEVSWVRGESWDSGVPAAAKPQGEGKEALSITDCLLCARPPARHFRASLGTAKMAPAFIDEETKALREAIESE